MWEWQEHYSEYEMNAEMGHSRPRTHEDPTVLGCYHTQPIHNRGVYVRAKRAGDRKSEPPYYSPCCAVIGASTVYHASTVVTTQRPRQQEKKDQCETKLCGSTQAVANAHTSHTSRI